MTPILGILGFGIFGLLLLFLAVVLGVAAFVFWIAMLIHAIQNPRLSGNQRIVWVLVIVFLHFLGAIIYFFAGRSQPALAN
ncbi:MAG TPA: PLD nuclease N-terminal domain-containing protein [Verrucomicrobiae bacterium]|nr:PLD nuclease N-terminal domain-containing protein [Verrucomicrobiae bacterium]